MEHEVSYFDFKIDIPYVIENKRIELAKDELLSDAQNIINEIETAGSVFKAVRFAAEAISHIEEYIQEHYQMKDKALEEKIKKLLIQKCGQNFLFAGPEGEIGLFDCCSPIMKRIEILTKLIENYKNKMILEEKQKIIEVLRDSM
jgi:hypothetical protein